MLQAKGRLHELDALRGLAAIGVFINHASSVITSTGSIYLILNSPLRFLWNGAAAVSLFFVLSGFVLCLPYLPVGKSVLRVDGFIVRRIFRLYPAYWFAVAIALLLLHFTPGGAHGHGVTAWFAKFWQVTPTVQQVLRYLTLIGPGIDPDAIDPVIWSLMVEMRVSLIFPLIILLFSSTRKWLWDILVLAAVLAIGIEGHRHGWIVVASLPQFFLGAVAAKYRDRIVAWIGPGPLPFKTVLLVIGILLYGNDPIFPGMFEATGTSLYVTALGAVVIIMVSLSSRVISGALKTRAIVFYGDISYSLYLVHFPILLFLTPRLIGIPYAHGVIAVLAFILTTIIAAAMFRFIELPLQALGASIARWSPWRQWSKALAT